MPELVLSVEVRQESHGVGVGRGHRPIRTPMSSLGFRSYELKRWPVWVDTSPFPSVPWSHGAVGMGMGSFINQTRHSMGAARTDGRPKGRPPWHHHGQPRREAVRPGSPKQVVSGWGDLPNQS